VTLTGDAGSVKGLSTTGLGILGTGEVCTLGTADIFEALTTTISVFLLSTFSAA